MSVFVNMTNMVVNSDNDYTCGWKFILCQSDMSPEMYMISHTPRIQGIPNQLRWEKTAQKQKFQISHIVSN